MVRYKNRYVFVRCASDAVNRRHLSDALGLAKGKGPTAAAAASSGGQVQRSRACAEALEAVVRRCFGTVVSGPLLASLQVKVLDRFEGEEAAAAAAKGGLFSFVLLVRCERDYVNEVLCALALWTQLEGCKVACTCLHISGSMRTMDNFIRKTLKGQQRRQQQQETRKERLKSQQAE